MNRRSKGSDARFNGDKSRSPRSQPAGGNGRVQRIVAAHRILRNPYGKAALIRVQSRGTHAAMQMNSSKNERVRFLHGQDGFELLGGKSAEKSFVNDGFFGL